MERIKRNERMAALTKWLTDSPNQIFTLSQFCERFGSAKSTMSEDIDILRQVFETFELGRLETVTGAAAGSGFVITEDGYILTNYPRHRRGKRHQGKLCRRYQL